MKKYRVIISPSAEAEALAAFEYIRVRSPANAAGWLRGLYQTNNKLETLSGYGRAPESDLLECELRHINFKSYRIIFDVEESTAVVNVHAVRHAARRGLGEPNVEDR